jgi:hypothetical protein
MPDDGNSASASPTITPRTSNASDSEATNEEPIEVKERNLSDGFLAAATELHEIVDAPTEPTPPYSQES